MKKIHLIAIGGAIMHNLAIALKLEGHHVTGSDDMVFDPAASRLKEHGLLPDETGWHPDRVSKDLDLVVLGMHAKKDNPELQRAQQLGLKVVSFPEYIYGHSQQKQRVVIAGSHGKTTTTAMMMHLLGKLGIDFDYVVGSEVQGFENSVRLSGAPIIVIEGDEYLSSPLDLRPKMMWYRPHFALINGIEWDHVNVFPTQQSYLDAFRDFAEQMERGTRLYIHEDDAETNALMAKCDVKAIQVGLEMPKYIALEGKTYVHTGEGEVALQIVGAHNVNNMNAAVSIAADLLKRNAVELWPLMKDFTGAARRLEPLTADGQVKGYRDFAHAPSKVRATVAAVREQFPNAYLSAFLELHTFSSLNKDYLPQYAGSLAPADTAAVFIDQGILDKKGTGEIDGAFIQDAFAQDDIVYLNDAEELGKQVSAAAGAGHLVLVMSSGAFGKLDIRGLILREGAQKA